MSKVNNGEAIVTERGNILCYDYYSGRYFNSDIDKIKEFDHDKVVMDDGLECYVIRMRHKVTESFIFSQLKGERNE